MDSLTHIALGALVGEAVIGKKLGKKVLVIGAVAQSIPDIDFLAAFWLSPSENLLAHRGITHSIIFALLIAPLLAFLATKWSKTKSVSWRSWVIFIVLQLSIHLIIDSFNAYGIGWFEPFSHLRFSYNLLFVADPFFSLPFGVAAVALLILKIDSPARIRWIRIGLMYGVLYLSYAIYNKSAVERDLTNVYKEVNIKPSKYFSTPTPFNNWLWYAVAEVDSGYFVSYHSVFDSRPDNSYQFYNRNEQLLDSIHDQVTLKRLLQFSQGYYTLEQTADTLIFHDLRFGQITGWADPKAKFAFQYYLQPPSENRFLVQRGRFSNWNKETTTSFLKRIRGN